MPGIDQILETILSSARQDAGAAVSEAEARCGMIRRQADADLSATLEKIANETRSRCLEIGRRADVQLRLDRGRALLSTRRELIAMAFEQALKTLCEMPDDQFESFVADLMARAASTGTERVMTAPGERRIGAALIGRANRTLAARGLPGGLALSSETVSIQGGFMLEQDGVLTNCSFEMLLRQLRGGIEQDVVRILFPDGEG